MFWASMTLTICKLVSKGGRAKYEWFASSYSLLELGQIGGAESISLGNDGDQVDS